MNTSDINNPNQQIISPTSSRRQFLFKGSAIVMLAALSFSPMDLLAKNKTNSNLALANNSFSQLSRLLVGQHVLSAQTINSAWRALNKKHSNFSSRFSLLNSAIKQNNIGSIEQLKMSPLFKDDLQKETVMQIISAYYLGRVGDTNNTSAANSPEFVTYAEALMWEPTMDVTVIPTYSRAASGYWAAVPEVSSMV